MSIHTFTTRGQGDMKHSEENRKKVIKKLFGAQREFLETDSADVLISEKKDAAIGVFVADCVPILLSSDDHVAAIHAGWRQTLIEVTSKAVETMKQSGAGKIRAWMGPHISMCHYDVDYDRAKKFLHLFGDDPKVASFFENRWHVDLGWANYRQLIDAGVDANDIVASPTCTYCQNDIYFSFRKGDKERIMGVIGFV